MEKTLLCLLLATEWAFSFEMPSVSVNFHAPSAPRQTSIFPRRTGLRLETPGSAFPAMNLSVLNLAKRVKKLEKDREDEKNKVKRFNDLEKTLEKLLNDNKNKDVSLRDMETAQVYQKFALDDLYVEYYVPWYPKLAVEDLDLGFCLEIKEKRINDLERKFEKLVHDSENKAVRLGYMERALEKLLHANKIKCLRHIDTARANPTSELTVDCGSPTPAEGTDIVYTSTGLHAIANYRCKKGFLSIYPGQQMMSLCQKDGNWTMVNVKCVNISDCWVAPAIRMLYTGTRSVTTTGKVCQRWDSQKPQIHEYNKDTQFTIPGFDTPQTVTGSANYCRDPSRDGYLWCYTTDPNSRWEQCHVPKCEIHN